MKIFVLRRGESQPLGPLTAAEVADMRNRWQLSDADYYRVDGSDRWNLVGRLSGAIRPRPLARAVLPLAATCFALLALTVAFAPHFQSAPHHPSIDPPSTCAVDVPLERPANLLPPSSDADVPRPVLEASPVASPDLTGQANI